MLIVERIKTDHTAARKAQNKALLSILTTLFAEVEKVGKDKGNRATTDEESVAVIKKFITNASETLSCTQDSLPQEYLLGEIKVYESYLPKQLTEGEIRIQILNLKYINAAVKMPDVMKYFKEKFAGKYDGKLLSIIAKELTS